MIEYKVKIEKWEKSLRISQNIDIYDNLKLILPTHSLCSSLGTSSPHLIQLSSSTSIESLGHAQNKGFSSVGTLLPGQVPKKRNKV